jgi:hypothetical protein
MLPVEVAADEGKPGRFLLGGLAVETWGLKVTLRVTLGIGLAVLPPSRESRGDVSDMVVEEYRVVQAVIRGGRWVGGADRRCVLMVNVASRLLFHVLDVVQSIRLGYVRKCAVVRVGPVVSRASPACICFTRRRWSFPGNAMTFARALAGRLPCFCVEYRCFCNIT